MPSVIGGRPDWTTLEYFSLPISFIMICIGVTRSKTDALYLLDLDNVQKVTEERIVKNL